MKTISYLKGKLIDAIDSIDFSKVTLQDLKLLAETASIIAMINDKPFDFYEIYSKMMSKEFAPKPSTLHDLKEGE